MVRRSLMLCFAVAIFVGASSGAHAQQPTSEDVNARIERLEQKNEELLQLLQKMQSTQPGPASAAGHLGAPVMIEGATLNKDEVKKIVSETLKEEQMKAEVPAHKGVAEGEGYKVGTDLSMKASWKEGVVLYTPNNDFWMHIGGWIQYDNVFWDQSPALLTPPGKFAAPKGGPASGVAPGGIGDLQDGTYFRRIRFVMDGGFWENYEFTLAIAFENDQFSTIGLDEFWVGAKDIPLIGTARLGHVKNAIGLEADMSGSSKTMTFLERSSYSEAIELNQNFVTGLWLGNNYFDQRATTTFVAFRADQGSSSGVFFGDGQYGLQSRLTALPIYENQGRCLMHLGLSGGWRGDSNNIANSPFRIAQLRARPELRDDDPAGGGGGVVPNANSNRLIDTGVIAANSDWLMGTELLAIWGPLSLQAEYGWNWVEDARGFAPAGLKLNPALKTPQNYGFNGGYIQAAYTLTGENRSYDKRLGRLDTFYFGRQGPYNNAWFVRDQHGGLNLGPGAWEVAARYSYVNLNDGTGVNRVQGGIMEGLTLGLNWYLNTNLKLQFDWVYDHRDDVPAATISGYTSGFGVRMQYMW